VPIHFEAEPGHNGQDVENDIAELEKMAGRGNFTGAAQGAPPRIRVATVSRGKQLINLVPSNYRWTEGNANAPLWWVSGISWDDDAWRDEDGNRIRQFATVTLTQYVTPDGSGGTSTPSASDRNAANQPKVKTYTNQPKGGFARP